MLLIYVPKLTNRLGYTLNVVMRDILQTEFAITSDLDTFNQHLGAKLCYAPNFVGDPHSVYIKSSHLLFETVIGDQEYRYFQTDGIPMIFPVFGSQIDLPFDPFAAIFFMISRYEEYLPHCKDAHGRFLATESIAYKHGFLHLPVVDKWAFMVRDAILRHYPEHSFRKRRFNFVQTIDIDAAYCFKYKGVVRNIIGMCRDAFVNHDVAEVAHRIRVLRGDADDPYDSFDYIISQSLRYPDSQLLFFALLGDYGLYDKPASYLVPDFRQLIQHIGDYSKVGIHGSYYSAEDAAKLDAEIHRLTNILHRPIYRNRFHFLRFALPHAYRNLERLGIAHDYSMGFAELPGFRLGTCTIVPFFDLASDQELDIKLHPFVTMDTTFHTHMQLTSDEALAQYRQLIDEVRAVDGTFICIFHNQNLCESYGWQGWRNVYEEVLKYAYQND